MAKVRLSVSVGDSYLKDIDKIARAAAKIGMNVEQRLESIGVFTGLIEANKVAGLRKIAGVAGVEEERIVNLPPSGSPVQ
jgi:hypothetical protein